MKTRPMSASDTTSCSLAHTRNQSTFMRRLFRLTTAALASLALSACSNDAPNAANGQHPGSERIIAREAKNADTHGITLQLAGQQFFIDIGRTTGYRDSGMGDVSISLKASRIEAQSAIVTEVVIVNLRPIEGTQRVGEVAGRPVHIDLTGVPGHADTLRSVQGEVQVDSLVMDENQRFKSIDARFSGRFSALSDTGESFVDPTHADAVEISGRLSTAVD
jgi:hypothetical protein